MQTYYETQSGAINTGEYFIPKDHPSYNLILKQIEEGEASLVSYVPPVNKTLKPTITWEEARAKRNQLLKDSDWAMMPDVTLSNKEDWLKYRNHLRMIPQYYSNPNRIVWPEAPKNS
jgi:hypothetical protein